LYTEQDIKEFFTRAGFAGEEQSPEVRKIILTYDIDEIVTLQRQRAELVNKRRKLEA